MNNQPSVWQTNLYLPDNLQGLWIESSQLHDIFKRRGIPLLPMSLVTKCLRLVNLQAYGCLRNQFNKKTYYHTGDTTNNRNASRNSATPEFLSQNLLMGSTHNKAAISFLIKSKHWKARDIVKRQPLEQVFKKRPTKQIFKRRLMEQVFKRKHQKFMQLKIPIQLCRVKVIKRTRSPPVSKLSTSMSTTTLFEKVRRTQ